MSEAVAVNAVGAGLGVLVSGVLITSFSGLVRQTIGLGFLIPSLPVIAGLAAGLWPRWVWSPSYHRG